MTKLEPTAFSVVEKRQSIRINGQPLSIGTVCEASRDGQRLSLEIGPQVIDHMRESVEVVKNAVAQQQTVYGVTTGFGGMADVVVDQQDAADSQQNLLNFLATGAGDPIDRRHVRAAMLLRANVLARGLSGIRPEWVQRIARFLEADATPVVRQLGSIGASGDLVPLSTIARAISGVSDYVEVKIDEEVLSGGAALRRLQLEPLELLPKEGLALVNGTSFSAAIAANCVEHTKHAMAMTLGCQALMLAGLVARSEPFDDFVHQQKPFPGQIWTAEIMRHWLPPYRTIADSDAETNSRSQELPQDRYSIRCLPQYMAPIVEGIARVQSTVQIEMNSVSDNPLVDVQSCRFYQGGNFLGQYTAMAMDDLRRHIGLMAKHMDVQIAALMTPEFSNGLPASLRGNDDVGYNMGLKGVQILGNSIMPMLTYHGNPLTEHYPTHAEQYNQNINGLSWGSAQLAWKSVELFEHYLSAAILVAIQAVDLRSQLLFGHYDGRSLLPEQAIQLYESVCKSIGCTPGKRRPFLFNDRDRWLEDCLAQLREALVPGGAISASIQPILDSFDDQTWATSL